MEGGVTHASLDGCTVPAKLHVVSCVAAWLADVSIFTEMNPFTARETSMPKSIVSSAAIAGEQQQWLR